MNQLPLDDHDTLPPSMDPAAGNAVMEPPRHLLGILQQLGPGLIIAGSIVGSGELIATTKTGAQAGISFLWLIIVGCLIKVFVQVELGRFTITHGETTLAALDQVPGPRWRVNWIIWYWLLMMLVSLGQLGGIVGGVGQAFAMSFPITGDYQRVIELPSEAELKRYLEWDEFNREPEKFTGEFPQKAGLLRRLDPVRTQRGHEILAARMVELDRDQNRGEKALELVRESLAAQRKVQSLRQTGDKGGSGSPEELKNAELQAREAKQRVNQLLEPRTWDDLYWAVGTTLFTIALLYRGSYGLIQNLSTALVVLFTFVTFGNVIALQNTQQWHISGKELWEGIAFGWPQGEDPWKSLSTALATFGIIGVGASELVSYPYWCLEKGYAKFTGPRSADENWARRARGWMNVMHYDTWCSMVIYTVATVAFYLMGVAVLHNEGRDPDGMRMVSTLSTAYVPVFGEYARWLFLIGAIAVLYSTFLVANASHARTFTDSFKLFGLMAHNNQRAHNRSISLLSVILPLICLGLFATGANPVTLVLLGGTMQAIMLPMLAYAALYFRHTKTDPRLKPGLLWDVMLVLSCIGLLVAGSWKAYDELSKLLH